MGMSKSRPITIFTMHHIHLGIFLVSRMQMNNVTEGARKTKPAAASRETGWRIFLSSLPNYNLKLDLITSEMKSQAAGPSKPASAFLSRRLVTGSEVATQIERLTTRSRQKKPRFAFAGVSRAAINLLLADANSPISRAPHANGCCLRCRNAEDAVSNFN